MSKKPRSLPIAQWPSADREEWLKAMKPTQRLIKGGRASHMKQVTQNDLERRYGYFLDFLERAGRLKLCETPAALVTEENVSPYLEELRARVCSVTCHGNIYKLRRMAEILDPGRDLSWLREVEAELDYLKQPETRHHRIVTTDRLVEAGLRLFEQAASSKCPALGRAIISRNGVMLALLALCPIRLRAFSGLTLKRSLIEIDGCWWITLSRFDTKSGRPDERPVPAMLHSSIAAWLETYRPEFKQAGDALWPSRKGGALSYAGVQRVITETTRALIGFPVSPHLFRSCAVSTTAHHAGSRMGIASGLLQHADPLTTEAHYNRGRMNDAVLKLRAVLDDQFSYPPVTGGKSQT